MNSVFGLPWGRIAGISSSWFYRLSTYPSIGTPRRYNQSGFVTMEKRPIEDDGAREPLSCQEDSGQGTHQPCWKVTANVESPFFLHFSESLREQAAICF